MTEVIRGYLIGKIFIWPTQYSLDLHIFVKTIIPLLLTHLFFSCYTTKNTANAQHIFQYFHTENIETGNN